MSDETDELATLLAGKLSPEKIEQVRKDLKAARDVEVTLAYALKGMSPAPDSAICITGVAILLGRMLAVSDSLVENMPSGIRRMRLSGVLEAVTKSYDSQTDELAAVKAKAKNGDAA